MGLSTKQKIKLVRRAKIEYGVHKYSNYLCNVLNYLINKKYWFRFFFDYALVENVIPEMEELKNEKFAKGEMEHLKMFPDSSVWWSRDDIMGRLEFLDELEEKLRDKL